MAVASLTPRAKFSLALAAQNFRPVNLDVLTRSAALDLGSVPPDLEAALRGAVRSTTNWSRIGEQLAVLRDGLNANGKYLLDVHIGATGGALKVVTACGFGGPPPLADTQFRRSCEFSWSVMQSLEAHIQQFEIQPELLAMLDAARSKYLNVTDPVTKAAVDLAWAMVSASRASGGPQAVYAALCFGGLSSELAGALRNYKYMFEQAGFGNQPSLEGLAWDCGRSPFDPDSLYFGKLEYVDDKRLRQALAL
ncbi:hypothetical protein OG851_00395 [Streptomyces sp. NBC_00161]|uniref:hypothetical protein n=1 Tax=Streptomyces sp. NBC_00161 TaxID=2975671 RepID=UPI00324CA314